MRVTFEGETFDEVQELMKRALTAAADPQGEPAQAAGPALEDVRQAVTALRGRVSNEQIRELIKKAGRADCLSGVAPEHYGALIEACREAGEHAV